MLNKTVNKKLTRGGFRDGSGRKKGSGKKTKICVSVHERTWNNALKRWNKKPSWLVDRLILSYVKRGSAVLEMGAAI